MGSLPDARPARLPNHLTAAQRHRLKQRAHGHKTAYRDRIRALIVLAAAAGHGTAVIAKLVGVSIDTARKWRARFAAAGMDGLTDRPRSGRPRRFSAVQRAEVTALACELPATRGVPLSKWSCLDLAREVIAAGIAESISASTVRRILGSDAIKPWQYRSWISGSGPRLRRQGKTDNLTSTTGPGAASRSAPPTTSSPATRGPRSRPAAAAIPPCPPAAPAPCGSSTTTTAAARSPT